MRTIKLNSKNRAAKWMMNKAMQNVKNFLWDSFYDIGRIQEDSRAVVNEVEVYFWGLRTAGSWLWKEGENAADDFAAVSNVIYKLEFDWNGTTFLTATKIK